MSKTHFSEDQRKELVTKLITTYGNQVTKETIVSYCTQN